MCAINRQLAGCALKIERNGLQIIVQREIFHMESYLQSFLQLGSYSTSMRTAVKNIDKIAIFAV